MKSAIFDPAKNVEETAAAQTVAISPEQARQEQKPKETAEPKMPVARIPLVKVQAGEEPAVRGRQIEAAASRAKQEAERASRVAYSKRLEKDLPSGVYALRLRNIRRGQLSGTSEEKADIQRLEQYQAGLDASIRGTTAMEMTIAESTAAGIVLAQGEDIRGPSEEHTSGLFSRLGKKLFGRGK